MKNQKGNPNQIKPNELRIGNILTSKTWLGYHRVDGIERIDDETFEVKTKGHVHRYEKGTWFELVPIPLTEELLLKCGFEPIPHFTVVNSYTIGLGRGRVLSIGDTENANQMAWIQSVEGSAVTDLICVHNFDYEGKMHIHQLQNIYFALTGEELKIEL